MQQKISSYGKEGPKGIGAGGAALAAGAAGLRRKAAGRIAAVEVLGLAPRAHDQLAIGEVSERYLGKTIRSQLEKR